MSEEKSTMNSRIYSQIHGEDCWPKVDKVSPCEDACPIHMDVPSYVVALSRGKFKEALEIAKMTNPFPYICGTVCHHPCETVCSRGQIDKPIAIRDLKRFIGEYQEKNGDPVTPVEQTKAERIAIVGSGPAGLTAAHDLVRKGYKVSVFEALTIAGGMFATGIPEFILPKKPVQMEIDYIRDLGVEIKTGIRIGEDLSLDDLRNQGYKAILISAGAWKSTMLPLTGKELKGVLPALDFLKEVKMGDTEKLRGTVCVIGGGNTAIDAARCAVRMGAKKVDMCFLESREQMPSYDWEVEAAVKEGVNIHPSLAPQSYTGKVGKVKGVDFKKVKEFNRDDSGKISWTLEDGPDSEVSLPADIVIVAIGQSVDASFVNGIALNDNGAIRIDPVTMVTSESDIFAAGDVVTQVGTVVGSIAAGHQAALSMDCYLQDKDLADVTKGPELEVLELDEEMVPSFLMKKDRWDMPMVSPKDAVRSFGEVELGYTEWQVIEEAKRCLNCRMCGNCLYGRSQICFETSARLMASK